MKVETGKGEELLRGRDESLAGTASVGLFSATANWPCAPWSRARLSTGRILVSVIVPISPELIDTLAPELGPIQFNVLRPESGNVKSVVPNVIATQQFVLRAADRDERAPGSKGSESVRQADHGHRGS